jgi:colanic acid biosynthesis glycosyl transferase WcaI
LTAHPQVRVLYLSQWFEPEPILKGSGFVRGLVERGHAVETVTGFPNYPQGKLYPGYRLRLHAEDIVDGVPVHRVALYPSHDRSSLRRIVNLFSFASSAAFHGIFRAKPFEVLYAYPPIPTALAAAAICAIRRKPYVMDVQDLWPDSVVKSGMPGTRWMERIIGAMCNFAYRRAARIVSQSQGIADRLVERGVPREKISVIYNWAHEDEPGPPPDLARYGFAGRFNIVYGGNFGRMQGLDVLIRAAQIAARQAPRLQLTLFGNGVETDRLREQVVQLGAGNVRIEPGVPREQVGHIFAAADVLVLHLINDPLFEITVPHKTQSYMAAGKPVLIGVAGEAARLVTDAGAGVAVEPGNAEAMAQAMVRLARMSPHELRAMGVRGQEFYRRRFSFAAAMDATDAVIHQAHSEGSRRG